MGIRKSDFGELDGRTVEAHEGDAGVLQARVIPYGAVLSELHVPDGAGRSADVVPGDDDLPTAHHFGAVPAIGKSGAAYGEHAGFARDGHAR